MNRRTEMGQKGRRATYALELPQYPNMGACSGATGVPIGVLKTAKKNGCPAFRNSRVDFGVFVKWWFENGDQDAREDWTKRSKRAEALLRETKLEEQRGLLVDRSLVTKFVKHTVTTLFFAQLDRQEQEYPSSLKGKSEIEIARECERFNAAVRKNFLGAIDDWERDQAAREAALKSTEGGEEGEE